MVESMTAEAVRDAIAADPTLPVIDTRPRADYESWHIPGAIHLAWDPGEEPDWNQLEASLPADIDRLVTVCALGASSFEFAQHLESGGFAPVAVLEDGMVAWSHVYDTAEVDLGSDCRCIQLKRLAKGCLGYVVADANTGEAVVIDAPRHHDAIAEVLTTHELTLTSVIDTHVHADHISGGPHLADHYDVPYRISEIASKRGLVHDHEPIEGGEAIRVGDRTLRALATPGHTRDSTSFYLDDTAVFTADTLFVDAVGRTELEDEDAAIELAGELHHSITDRLFDLPGDTRVLPGHFDPTAIGRAGIRSPVTTTIDLARSTIDMLAVDAETFVDRIVDSSAERPPHYRGIISINLGGRPHPGPVVQTNLELGPNRCAASG